MITESMEQNVIEITLNKAGFEYDIHSLVKAFYPGCEVRVHAEGEGEPGSSSDGYPDLSLQIFQFSRQAQAKMSAGDL